MDIKDLNKPQLILLAVLLSFITSIATGITTVTLMQQAPVSFTAPVNRVIQQTVEKIQQVEGKTTVQTVVVKEEDLVVDAIAKNKLSVFSVSKEVSNDAGEIVEAGAGKGFAVTKEGILAVDAASVGDKGTYYVKNESGKFKADFMFTDKAGFSFLKIGTPVDGKAKIVFNVPSFGDMEKMKIGQKVIIFGNNISSLIYEGNKDIRMSVTKSNGGGMVLDLDGNVVGIALSGDASFASINSINSSLKTLTAAVDGTSAAAAPILVP